MNLCRIPSIFDHFHLGKKFEAIRWKETISISYLQFFIKSSIVAILNRKFSLTLKRSRKPVEGIFQNTKIKVLARNQVSVRIFRFYATKKNPSFLFLANHGFSNTWLYAIRNLRTKKVTIIQGLTVLLSLTDTLMNF